MSWPDPEGAIRSHLRSNAAVNAIVGNRVFFGVPRGSTDATFPLVTVSRVGGGEDAGEAPIDVALIDVSIWGRHDNKAEATALLNAVRDALAVIRTRTTLTPGTDVAGANVVGVVWSPDDTDRPRYSVTAEVTAISS